MVGKQVSLTIGGLDQPLTLLPQRGMFWEAEQTLLIADPHFGKAFAFRSGGIPVPPGTTGEDLKRLSGMLRALRPQKLIVLGDLLHARVAEARELLRQVQAWRRKWSEIQIILVSGNHDRRAGRPPDAFGIDQVVEAYPVGPFTFRHRPRAAATEYVMAGHIHPATRVRGVGRQKETLPCFYFGPRYGLLPAFGGFTGMHVLTPEKGSRLFAVAEDEIIEISPVR